MELALGTVQFGLRYGVAGRGGAVPEAEVRAILRRAWDAGIRVLDTAPAYGDIEARLAGLMDGLGFEVVSKLPPLPQGLDGAALDNWAQAQVARSRERLGGALSTLLFHRADDLLGPQGGGLWLACARACAEAGIGLGASCYDPPTLDALAARHPLALAQVPANALDQRFAQPAAGPRPPLHLRSAFLQGLLLMPEADGADRVPTAAPALRAWHRWCAGRGLAPLAAALGFARAVPGATHCVVGVDGPAHLDTLVQAWRDAPALHAPELACHDAGAIDPRRWPPTATA